MDDARGEGPKHVLNRREFLGFIGAAGAAAGCARTEPERLIPYLVPPENIVPGTPLFYRTVCRECAAGCGVTARTREGRAIKLEGNPDDPIGGGALCARGQAAVQRLYSPDRLGAPLQRGAAAPGGAAPGSDPPGAPASTTAAGAGTTPAAPNTSAAAGTTGVPANTVAVAAGSPGAAANTTAVAAAPAITDTAVVRRWVVPRPVTAAGFSKITWDDALAAVQAKLADARGRSGSIRFLTRPEPGSAGAAQRAFMASLGAPPEARIVVESGEAAALRAASQELFGRSEVPAFDLAAARSIVSFGADFIDNWISPVELSRGFAAGRGKVGAERTRLTWIGPRLSLTGASADQWLPARAGTEENVALALLRWICDPSHAISGLAPEAGDLFRQIPAGLDAAAVEKESGLEAGTLERLGRELSDRRPSAVLGPGASGGNTRLARTVLALNAVLGNVGRTVLYGVDPGVEATAAPGALRTLLADMAAGNISVLFVHHVDLLGTVPAALGAAAALEHVPFIVSFSDRLDATTRKAHLVLPDNHTLESFGDITPRKGLVELGQPVMTPLWNTRSASQVLLDLLGGLANPAVPAPSDTDFPAFMRTQLAALLSGTSDEQDASWRAALQKGGFFASAAPEAAALSAAAGGALANIQGAPAPAAPPAAESGQLDLVLFPGGPRDDPDAAWSWLNELPDPLTTVSWSGWVELSPGAARRLSLENGDVVSVRTPAGAAELPAYIYPGLRDDTVAVPLGAPGALNLVPAAFDDMSGAVAWPGGRVNVARTGKRALLPRLEGTPYTLGRENIIRSVSAAAPAVPKAEAAPGMYPLPVHPKHRWGMAIDLDRCTGCQACVVACYAENNVPVNGPVFASRGRNQEWLRVERYFGADGQGRPTVDFLLMLCQHCTNAPCEPVCPTYAAYHTSEGLNAQVYNRCVGTRYCSNNCPYKVRVFNWRDPLFPEPLGDQLNPDVTVRSKGVMEKCTFCIQRIRSAEIAAEREHRNVADGEIVTACAQTCPAGAIVFGDLNDPRSRVSQLAADGRAYRVLDHLGTAPGITYLARVRETV